MLGAAAWPQSRHLYTDALQCSPVKAYEGVASSLHIAVGGQLLHTRVSCAAACPACAEQASSMCSAEHSMLRLCRGVLGMYESALPVKGPAARPVYEWLMRPLFIAVVIGVAYWQFQRAKYALACPSLGHCWPCSMLTRDISMHCIGTSACIVSGGSDRTCTAVWMMNLEHMTAFNIVVSCQSSVLVHHDTAPTITIGSAQSSQPPWALCFCEP